MTPAVWKRIVLQFIRKYNTKSFICMYAAVVKLEETKQRLYVASSSYYDDYGYDEYHRLNHVDNDADSSLRRCTLQEVL